MTELLFVYIQRIDLIVIDDGAQPRAGQRHLRVGIFALQVVNVQGAGQSVLAEIGQAKQGGERHAAHTAHQRPLLGVKPVGPDPLVPQQVQRLILIRIVSLLEHRYIVRAALVQITVFICVDRINLKAHHAEVFPRQLAGISDVGYIALTAALAGQNQDFLHAAVSDHLHFFFDLLHGQLHTADVVIAVEAAVDAVIFAVIGDI